MDQCAPVGGVGDVERVMLAKRSFGDLRSQKDFGNEANILSEAVHEGTHALDFLKGLPAETATDILSMEKRAFFFERQFQLATGQALDFLSVKDMLKFIAEYYP